VGRAGIDPIEVRLPGVDEQGIAVDHGGRSSK
jgi:hypothetical protein